MIRPITLKHIVIACSTAGVSLCALLVAVRLLPAQEARTPVCPLTAEQELLAVGAFSQLAPSYQQPRCLKCHGTMNPLGSGGTPPGEIPGVKPRQSFPDKNQTELCLLTKSGFESADQFLAHLQSEGQSAELATLLAQAKAWVQAMGGRFPKPVECGCIARTTLKPGSPGSPGLPPGPGQGPGGPGSPQKPSISGVTPNFKLTVHQRWEVNYGYGQLLSDVTFPIDLVFNAQGTFMGQTAVPREYRSTQRMGPTTCEGSGKWSEVWQVNGSLNEHTGDMTMKLRFDATPKQDIATCYTPVGPITRQSTQPPIRSDSVRTPLDGFTMPAKAGAQQHFEFVFGPGKNTVDVTLVEPGQ